MRLIRSLIFPWFLYFVASVAGHFLISVKYPHMQTMLQPYFIYGLAVGAFLCVMANIRSMGNVGIWMAESLPESLRYGSGRWIYRAVLATAIGTAFVFSNKLPWMPLVWQAIVSPTVFTICVFVVAWSLLGPVLKWSSNMSWSRAFAIILSLPLLAGVTYASLFVGQTVEAAYRAKNADLVLSSHEVANSPQPVQLRGRVLSVTDAELRVYGEWPEGSGEPKTFDVHLQALPADLLQELPKAPTKREVTMTVDAKSIEEAAVTARPNELNHEEIRTRLKSTKPASRASALREIYEFSESCSDYTKDIQSALEPKGPKQVVYWALQAVECSDMRSVVGLPKLVQIMTEHPDPDIRATAIRSMGKFGTENVRQIAYLLLKRIDEDEPPQVVEAAALALAPLGGDEVRWATNRLKTLLDSDKQSEVSARVLTGRYGRTDLVAESVSTNLPTTGASRSRAVNLICLLPPASRSIAEPHVANILAEMSDATQDDPGVKSLACLGRPGFEAIRQELNTPQHLPRPIAAHALALLDIKDFPEAIEISNTCARDSDDQVRSWCSQTLGQLGAPALPMILDLLKSGDPKLKESGRNALRHFEDIKARPDLQRIVRENSGWMANNQKLQIAKAVGSTLVKIETKSNGYEATDVEPTTAP